MAVFLRYVFKPDPFFAPFVVHHANGFCPQVATNQRSLARLQARLEGVELIWVYCTLNDGLAQAVGGVDEYHVPKAGFRIQGEHHAAAGQVAAHHALNTRRQGNMAVLEALVNAVCDGAVVKQGGKHFVYRVEHVL